MKRTLERLALGATGVLLATLSGTWASEAAAPPSSPAEIAAKTCEAVLDGLRRTEAATLRLPSIAFHPRPQSALQVIRGHLRPLSLEPARPRLVVSASTEPILCSPAT